jgi:pilus assembly protein CpaF
MSHANHLFIEKIKQIFANNDQINEIMFQGEGPAVALQNSCWDHLPETPFKSLQQLTEFAYYLADRSQRRLDGRHPFQGGRMDCGFRWHAVVAPVAPESTGCTLHIRKTGWLTGVDHQFNKFQEFAPKIRTALKEKQPVVVYGKTGCGKSSFLNMLLKKFCMQERVVIIESLEELELHSHLWSKMICREKDVEGLGEVTMDCLFSQALRMKPDRIVIGEIRVNEASTFLEAGRSGHTSTFTTIHAGNDEDAISRIRKIAETKTLPRLCLIKLDSEVSFTIGHVTIYDQRLS